MPDVLPPGPYSYRPNEHDDWGFVRDANGDIVANTCPSRLVHKFHDEFDYATNGYGDEWKAGPPQARAVAQLLIDAEANQRKLLEVVAECERLRELILAADRVTKERFTSDGLCDCIDNNGRPYQSEWAAKIIQALQEPTR